jgi:hypothetical protein
VQVVRQLHVLLEQRHHTAHRAFRIDAHFLVLRDHLDDDAVEALVFLPLHRARPLDALDEHLDVAIRQLQALDDVGDAAHREDIRRLRIVDGGVVLRREKDPLVLHQRVLQRPRRRRPADDERHHHVRKHDNVAERDDG